jgi:hypothetical protein
MLPSAREEIHDDILRRLIPVQEAIQHNDTISRGYLRANPSLGRQWGEGILGRFETDPARVPRVRMGPETPPSTAKTKFKNK